MVVAASVAKMSSMLPRDRMSVLPSASRHSAAVLEQVCGGVGRTGGVAGCYFDVRSIQAIELEGSRREEGSRSRRHYCKQHKRVILGSEGREVWA